MTNKDSSGTKQPEDKEGVPVQAKLLVVVIALVLLLIIAKALGVF